MYLSLMIALETSPQEQQPKKLVEFTLSDGALTASYPPASTQQVVGNNVVYS